MNCRAMWYYFFGYKRYNFLCLLYFKEISGIRTNVKRTIENIFIKYYYVQYVHQTCLGIEKMKLQRKL